MYIAYMHNKKHKVGASDVYNQAGNVLDPNNKKLAEGFFSAGNMVDPSFLKGKKGKGCGC